MLIAGDIGGTITRLALVSPERGPRKFVAEQEFLSTDYEGMQSIVETFLAKTGGHASSACFDVAGPVIGGRAHLTNLPWDLDEAALCRSLRLPAISLLNDLAAIAHAVPHLQLEETVEINVGKAVERARIAVLAPDVAHKVPAELRNTLGIAVSKQTYVAYRDVLESDRFQRLANVGARPQRLLFASTGTKDKDASDTLYISALAAPNTVNTMPEETLLAFADHGTTGSLLPRDGATQR